MSVAFIALPSPSASPVPIIALPIELITVSTSAKSKFTKPSLTIKSVILCTPCLKTSFESLNDSLKVVFTNGCFDILHAGHIRYLEAAKQLGDELIVGINSDQSVKALKGKGRPLNTLVHRAEVLASLKCVDKVVVFEDKTPIKLIKAIKPNILVKGGDYKVKEIVGYEVVTESGGRVVTVPLVDGLSTTNIISKMR